MLEFAQEKKYVGHMNQLLRVQEYRMIGGRGDGMLVVDVQNGDVQFVLNASRAMDIHHLRYKGYNLGFLSPVGDVAPQYFDDKAAGWARSFTAGFLTTCGLQYIGKPDEFDGVHNGLHGRIGNTPADSLSHEIAGDTPSVILKGVMNEGMAGGDTLKMERTVACAYKEPGLHIRDEVTNTGYMPARHMMLYHFNIGYPLLCEDSEFIIPSKSIRVRDEHAQAHIGEWSELIPPQAGFAEMCYYHELLCDSSGNTCVAVYNKALGIGVAINFSKTVLDHFVQWRQMGAGFYALGLEPCNGTIDGIKDALERSALKTLEPGQSVTHELQIRFIGTQTEWDGLKALTKTYR